MKAIFLLAGKKPSVVDGAQAGSLAYMIIDDEGWTFKKEEDFKVEDMTCCAWRSGYTERG